MAQQVVVVGARMEAEAAVVVEVTVEEGGADGAVEEAAVGVMEMVTKGDKKAVAEAVDVPLVEGIKRLQLTEKLVLPGIPQRSPNQPRAG